MSLIELKDVSKVYNKGKPDEKTALNRVSIDVSIGSCLAFTGVSGSGKSTLLNIIGLMDTPTSGSYFLNGVDMSGLSDSARAKARNMSIGFIFQNFGLIDDRNVLENVLTPILFDPEISMRKGKRMAMEALEKVGLASMYKKRVTKLSGGERQRVSIARATVKKHDIILADEPTGQLDTVTADMIMDLLIDLNKEGATLLVVTHSESVASRFSTRYVMRDGEIFSNPAM